MSILIRSMEIPTSCDKCRFCVNGFTDAAPMYECAVQSCENVSVLVESDGKPFNFRPDWCPLVEIPIPHGRLIDADKLIDGCEKLMRMLDPEGKEYLRVFAIKSYLMWAAEYAVIEAEGRVTE